ncbi:lytic transglycosylase domain-containing protein [Novosphingobium sp.]|uniref:lytic transglycosylase domain-containing protein n=1 Tax=Novosphingobium sp. TaxID=1874826 RepID=UPI003BAA2D9F
MSEPSTIAAPAKPRPAPDVRGAIARAAAATGTDFSYLMAQARLESGLDPQARAATSSAAGLYQFTGQTWLSMLDKHGAAFGVSGAGNPASRAQLLALRSDPELSALMAGQLANDNRDFLSGVLGRDPDASELYLAHFLGAEGAGRFLGALGSNPAQSAAALLPRAAAANRGVFFGQSGARSVGEVMELLRGRMGQAMNAPDGPLPAYAAPPEEAQGGPIQQAFRAAAQAPDTPPARSMADTLREAFALAQPGAAPAHVRAAYGQLRSLGI